MKPVNLLVQEDRPKIWPWFLAAFLIGFLAPVILYFVFKPAPGPVKVTENPTKPATVTVEKQGEIQATGTAKLPLHKPVKIDPVTRDPGQADLGEGTEGGNTPEEGSGPSKPFYGLLPGDTIQIPVKGTESSTYINKKTGEVIGTGTHTIEGVIEETIKEDSVEAKLTIKNNTVIGFDIPEAKKPKNEIGVWLTPELEIQADYRRDILQLGNASLAGNIKIGYDMIKSEVHHEERIGITYKF